MPAPTCYGLVNRRIRRQFVAEFAAVVSPFSAIVAEFGDCSRHCGQGFRGEMMQWILAFTGWVELSGHSMC